MQLRLWHIAFALIGLLATSEKAQSQIYQGQTILTPALVTSTTGIAPGRPFTVGILLKVAPGWHTYGEFPGDAGAPLSVEWKLPPGFQAGPLQWPVPKAHIDEGDLLTYIYEDEVLLPVTITPPAQLPSGSLTLRANLQWLVCAKVCVPGKGEVEITLVPQQSPAEANHELFARWNATIPQQTPPPFDLVWSADSKSVLLTIRPIPPDTSLEFFPLPPDGVVPGRPTSAPGEVPDVRTFTIPLAEGAAGIEGWRGVLVAKNADGKSTAWSVASEKGDAKEPQAANVTPDPKPTRTVSSQFSLWSALLAAFIGGLILNLMPCVLPVIALKIFGFLQQAHEDPKRVFRLGLAFVAGVFAFFLGIACLAIVLQQTGRSFNLGQQFQNGYVLMIMIGLVFVFALAMLGVFDVTLPSGAATPLAKVSGSEGYSGAFFHGLFTTLLGTSCTAPILGPVLGFAVVQPAPIVLLLFSAMAAGMSFPYFLLTWKPAWMRFLPKPGIWMERMKQAMGFVLMAVVLWLLGVFAHGRGSDAVLAAGTFLLVLSVGSWLYGASRKKMLAGAIAVLMAVGGWIVFVQGAIPRTGESVQSGQSLNPASGIQWQAFSTDRLQEALTTGRPVFIDFTAEWCVNCKYNEKFVIETDAVQSAFRDKHVIALKADWTHQDPAITRILAEYGRVAVPVYVLYPGGGAEPIILPEILTRTLLLRHLASLSHVQ